MLYSFNDDMLKQAILKVDQDYINSLPNDSEIAHRFSHKFKKKMKKLLSLSKNKDTNTRNVKWSKRIAILVVCLIILFTSSMSVAAVRKVVFEFISDVYEKYTDIFFKSSDNVGYNDFLQYKPTYIPAGFMLTEEDTEGHVYQEYMKGEEYILYEQENLDEVSLRVNTEGVEIENTEFEGLPAKYYSNQGVQNLIWYDDIYMYSISSTLDKDQVYKIAESVRKN